MESRLAIYDTVTPVETSTSPLVLFIVLYHNLIVKKSFKSYVQAPGSQESPEVWVPQNASAFR